MTKDISSRTDQTEKLVRLRTDYLQIHSWRGKKMNEENLMGNLDSIKKQILGLGI